MIDWPAGWLWPWLALMPTTTANANFMKLINNGPAQRGKGDNHNITIMRRLLVKGPRDIEFYHIKRCLRGVVHIIGIFYNADEIQRLENSVIEQSRFCLISVSILA